MAKKYSLVSDGFDLYFKNLVKDMTPAQQELIPTDLYHRVLTAKGEVSYKTPDLTFEEKVVLLWKVFKKDVYIHLRDGDYIGITPDDVSEADVNNFVASGEFCLTSGAVCDGLYVNSHIGESRMYQHVKRLRNAPTSKLSLFKDGIVDVSRMLIHYEGEKKRFMQDMKLTMPEWYALMYYADGLEKKGNGLYKKAYFNAFQTGRSMMLKALRRLSDDGYLLKIVSGREVTYRMTVLGRDLLYKMYLKYILSY